MTKKNEKNAFVIPKEPSNIVEQHVCITCGTSSNTEMSISIMFPYSTSKSLSKNNRLRICYSCLNRFYSDYCKALQDPTESIKRMCMRFDFYFSEQYVSKTLSNPDNGTRFEDYLRYITKSKIIKGKTYDDYINEQNILNQANVSAVNTARKLYKENDKEEKGNDIISDYVSNTDRVALWGSAFDDDDYEFLDNQFVDWQVRCTIDTKARESLVRDLCVIKLLEDKALMDKDTKTYRELLERYNKTLNDACLSPKQVEADDKASEKPLGVFFQMFEKERPAPDPDDEWKDVDGIMKLIYVYFLGHLFKMIGIKNRYSAQYEAEMQKYTVTIPELQDADSEDIFDYLIENGFYQGEKKKKENEEEDYVEGEQENDETPT